MFAVNIGKSAVFCGCEVMACDIGDMDKTMEDILQVCGDQVGLLTVQSIGLLHASQVPLALGLLQQGTHALVMFVELTYAQWLN